MYVYSVYAWYRCQIPLDLELWMVRSYRRGDGNKILVLCRSNQCSHWLSHLSRPLPLSAFTVI